MRRSGKPTLQAPSPALLRRRVRVLLASPAQPHALCRIASLFTRSPHSDLRDNLIESSKVSQALGCLSSSCLPPFSCKQLDKVALLSHVVFQVFLRHVHMGRHVLQWLRKQVYLVASQLPTTASLDVQQKRRSALTTRGKLHSASAHSLRRS